MQKKFIITGILTIAILAGGGVAYAYNKPFTKPIEAAPKVTVVPTIGSVCSKITNGTVME